MDMFPVFCALLSFVLIGPSDANVVTLELGSAIKGERRNFKATCNGTCKGVSATVTALSGFPHLYAANDSLPLLGYCNDCFSIFGDVGQNISFQCSSSFAISVVAYTDFVDATLMVDALNLDEITNIILLSERLNLGSSKRGDRRDFKLTCYGPCEQVSAFVRATSGCPILHGKKNSNPHLDDDKRCKDCFCESVAPWWLNICQYKSFEDSSSLIFSVTALTDYKNAFLMVEAINFQNLEEIVKPFQVLNLGSSRVGKRKNFYVTCHGPCSLVNVRALSGNPKLFLAKNFIPFLQRSGCKNCLKDINQVSFKDSSSFALSVPTASSSDSVKVEAANLKDIREIIYPSITVDAGNFFQFQEKFYKFTCYGPCKELRVSVPITWGAHDWHVSTKKPVTGWADYCKNCFCERNPYTRVNNCNFRSLDESSTFVVLIKCRFGTLTNVKLIVEAFNLKV